MAFPYTEFLTDNARLPHTWAIMQLAPKRSLARVGVR